MKRAAWAIILLGTAPAMADAEAPNREPFSSHRPLPEPGPRAASGSRSLPLLLAAARNHQVWDEACMLEAMC